MIPFQGKIIITDNKISTKSESNTGVEVHLNGIITYYPEAYAYPGFADSHGHIGGLGISLKVLNLENCRSAEECVFKAYKNPFYKGNWLYGRGWNHENWKHKILPNRKILDDYFADIPCYFARIDGHAVWVNTKALQLAKIDRFTNNPPGGIIEKDIHGIPTGVLVDNAMNLVFKQIPPFTTKQLTKMLLNAMNALKSSGITLVQDMDVGANIANILIDLDKHNQLPIKIRCYLKAQNDEWIKFLTKPYVGNKLKIIGLKFYADGALGSSGAALFLNYSDDPTKKGLLLIDEHSLIEKIKTGLENGFHIAVHAIGDAANNMVVKAFEKVRLDGYSDNSHILRIEHAQILEYEDIEKIAKNKIFVSVQPIHCLKDAAMARKRLGNRVSSAYLWKTLLNAGIKIAGGSDFPIESYNPLSGMDAFINRIPFEETEPWFPDERLTPEEALDAYTVNARAIIGEKPDDYVIRAGNEAEITILDKDITKIKGKIDENVKFLDSIC